MAGKKILSLGVTPAIKETQASLDVAEGDHPADSFLKTTAQLESSDGLNTDHKPVQTGPRAGSAAIGKYGVMPYTAKQVSTELSNPKSLLYQTVGTTQNQDIRTLKDLTEDEIDEKLKADPHLERAVSRALASTLMRRHDQDLDKSAYGWRMGDKLKSDQITKEKLDKSGYVKEFRRLKKRLK